ncbi:hypothetical protein [Microbulbifer hydrolyticus]|uniref:Uncharacterized protein n=1 Tax=Microbulbifer hydrolyticus TaxID=48074 RepID=A0A6P1TBF8_9GAMM|nr:hypothetical protein [Microbulbifer hydrolyticus]MBB5212471.1 hypothetical protein [Microbulbifer hydrolyticus]QHQ40098.1 hypothetical protein GTQ55_14645 [Microbulbifer hydrolyticus]
MDETQKSTQVGFESLKQGALTVVRFTLGFGSGKAGYCNLVYEKLFLRAFLVVLVAFYSLSAPNRELSRAITKTALVHNTWSTPLWHVLLVSMYQTTSTP